MRPMVNCIYEESALILQEKFSMLKTNESLLKENDKLKLEKQSLLRSKDLADAQAATLKKSLESLQRDIKEKENQVLQSHINNVVTVG